MAETKTKKVGAAVKAETVPKNTHKVLIAEDNPVVRAGLKNFLGQWGYIAVEAADGNEAWKILEKDHSIRLAVLDWNLPGLNGMEVCQRIRRREKAPYIYTLIFSARNSVKEQTLALEQGADDYLAKPAKPSLLRARLLVGQRIIDTILAKH